MCELTIIIPVYNAEKYIDRCIQSLSNQNLENVEVILIDDGSNDKSKEILKSYARENLNHIKFYEKSNTGVADTRNFGIKKALGNYIMFIDVDDTIEKGLIDILKQYMKSNIDIIKYKLDKVDNNGNIIQKIDGPVFEKTSGQDAVNKLAFADVLIDSPCIYAFKRELFTKNNLWFMPNTLHEDFGLIPLIIVKAKTFVSINLYGYHYLQTNNSIVRNEDYKKTIKRFEDVLLHYDNMIKFVDKENLNWDTKENLKAYYTNVILLKLKELNNKDIGIYTKEIKRRKMIKNIKVKNIRQFLKKIILNINIKLYLKLK